MPVGRPTKPIAEIVAGGHYRPSRHGPLPGDAPVPLESVVRPATLEGRAAQVWDELVEILGGMVRRRDTFALAELCRWVARSEKIAAELDPLPVTAPGFRQAIIPAGITTDKLMALLARFGMTPADRARIKADVSAAPAKPKVAVRPKQFRGENGPPKK